MWGEQGRRYACEMDVCKYNWLLFFRFREPLSQCRSTAQLPSSSHWHSSQRLLLQDDMSATTDPFPLASEKPYGDDSAPDVDAGTEAGASGDSSSNSVSISQGGMIAIIVVVVFVSLIGISTAVLFFVAKKREWRVKETIRRSARKVVAAITPRRSEFPSSVKDSHSLRNRTRIDDDVPPTPGIRPEDLEKGLAKAEAKRKEKGWGRK